MNEEQIFFSGKKSKSSLFDLSQNSVTKIRENLITIFVALHWIAVIVSLFLYHPKQNVLTNISNYLQLILNSCTLTTSLINPILKNSVYQRILKILKLFDSNISTLGLNLEYKKTNLRHMLAFVAVILYITYMISYDLFNSAYIRSSISLPYFTITRIPRIIYFLALCNAVCLLHSINWRFKLINKILKSEQLEVQGALSKKDNTQKYFSFWTT